jgi:hypothetical protein
MQQVDADETHPLEATAQLGQLDCAVRPTAYGLFEPAWQCRGGFCVPSNRKRCGKEAADNSGKRSPSACVLDLPARWGARLAFRRYRQDVAQNSIPG